MADSNTIVFSGAGEEMLKVSPDGFWVRGQKLEKNDKEIEEVYNAFKAWLVWANLSKE